MNVSITWNPGDTWRKLGYFYYTNSLDYRSVIEQNPQWNVMANPPEGTVLSLDVDSQRSQYSTNNAGFFTSSTSDSIQEQIFPFEYEVQYFEQAAKYSLYSIVNYNEVNGYTQDTPEAASGNP